MTHILTVTPNPAIDLSTSVAKVAPSRKLRCGEVRRDPGGGGLNVARVAGRLGARTTAVIPVGGETGRQLEALVRAEGVHSLASPIAGATRENVTVLDLSSGDEFRFVMPGPRLADLEWMACLSILAKVEERPTLICASGSLPPGAPRDFYARVAEIAEMMSVPFVLDTSGPPLAEALRERIRLIKPNLVELQELVGVALNSEKALVGACRELISTGRTEAVALTLGADGALLVTHDEAWRGHAPDVAARSTVGAGDSFMGAMAWALAEGQELPEAFAWGCAAGAAAVLQFGTELSLAEDVRRLVPHVRIEKLTARAPSTV